MVRTLCFHGRGPGFNPWSGNWDPTSCIVQVPPPPQKKREHMRGDRNKVPFFLMFHFSLLPWIYITFLTKNIHSNFLKRPHFEIIKKVSEMIIQWQSNPPPEKRWALLKTRGWKWNIYIHDKRQPAKSNNVIKLNYLIAGVQRDTDPMAQTKFSW